MSNPLAEHTFLVAFGAHPDDVEFGCGGVIALETRAGRAAHIVVCSRGESATHGTAGERARESEVAAQVLGASLEQIELDGDARLEMKSKHAIRIAQIIRRQRPMIVLAPSVAENQHPDHSRLGRLVRDAARIAPYGGVADLKHLPAHAVEQVFFYVLSPGAEPPGVTPILVDVSAPEVVAAWTAAMQAHATQVKARNYVELQIARARVSGLRAGVGHAIALYPNDPPVVDSLSRLGPSASRF